ncbi:thioredoxin family protein [Candidatus Korobacter versatilis]|nr:thioredoxin family protein [Candidatus Koribacter versatilis]
MKRFLLIVFLLATVVLPTLAGSKKDSSSTLPHTYDATRDPAKDLAVAIAEAHATDRNILLDVGGTWCKWCGYLDKFFTDHADLRELRDKNFVVMYVNFGADNKNDKFLAQFPKLKGCPHLYVLTADGKLLKSQDTSDLEDGKSSYVPEKVRAFLTEYGREKQ